MRSEQAAKIHVPPPAPPIVDEKALEAERKKRERERQEAEQARIAAAEHRLKEEAERERIQAALLKHRCLFYVYIYRCKRI